jgi:hypothetical protein
MEVNKSPYDKAFAYGQECIDHYRRRRPLKDDYERPLVIKISMRDWIKLYFDLGLDCNNDNL